MSGDRAIRLFVVDTGPLITLAVAQSLDYLLYVERAKLVIPDAVFYEATHDGGKLGAEDILEWASRNRDRIEFVPTATYSDYDAARSVNPSLGRRRHLGEQAAIEVINDPGRLSDEEVAVLLCEETAIMRGRFSVDNPDRLIVVSTTDFLRALESEQRIQSADAVIERAMAAGRRASQYRAIDPHDAKVRAMIVDLVRRSPDEDGVVPDQKS